MPQSCTRRTAWFRPVALKLPLPTYYTRDPFRLWSSQVAPFYMSIYSSGGTSSPLIAPAISRRLGEIVEVSFWRGIRGRRHDIRMVRSAKPASLALSSLQVPQGQVSKHTQSPYALCPGLNAGLFGAEELVMRCLPRDRV